MLLALVLLCCAGCEKKQEDSLQKLSLEDNKTAKNTEEEQEEKQEPEEPKEEIFVHVCGAVQLPGVYELKSGARIYEAVALAGGMRADAAAEYVNQAQLLTDGQQVYIPTETEVQQNTVGSLEIAEPEGTDHSGKVNLNTASKEELMTLNGIGETRAESILAYRDANGGFQTIEDLMKVEGIKEGVFDKIKDRITVNTGS